MNKKGTTPPLISILMTSYNCELYIEEAINSIVNQTYTNWELLIADDCSTDGTRIKIDGFKDGRIKTFHNDTNLHYLRTRNKLVNHVNGSYITLLDADDTCSPERLEKQLAAFDLDENLGLCGTCITYMDASAKKLNISDTKILTYKEIKEGIKTNNIFTGSTIMVKTSVWKEFNGYRDYFNSFGYEDYDLTSRIIEKHKAINIPEKLYHYRQYPESFTKNNLLANPFKLHGYKLIQQFIKQRAITGADKLMENDFPWIINFILEENKPYVKDTSLIYRDLAWSSFNRQSKITALHYCFKALLLKPLELNNYKLLLNLLLIACRFKKV